MLYMQCRNVQATELHLKNKAKMPESHVIASCHSKDLKNNAIAAPAGPAPTEKGERMNTFDFKASYASVISWM